MFIWKKQFVENKKEYFWILVDEDDQTKIIGSIIHTRCAERNYWKVDAECKEIGFRGSLDRVYKEKLGIVILDLKRFIKEGIVKFRFRNKDPIIPRMTYQMIDGIPMWQHLRNGAAETNIQLTSHDYGKIAEILGMRIIIDLTKRGGILNNIFPGVEIISVQDLKRIKVLKRKKIEIGDLILQVSCKEEKGKEKIFLKKIVIFEIKHGRFIIEQNQLRRYSSIILNPGEYFEKADEVKVIYVMFDKIDTLNGSATYSIREMDKNIAKRILEQEPITPYDNDDRKISEEIVMPELSLGQMMSQYEE